MTRRRAGGAPSQARYLRRLGHQACRHQIARTSSRGGWPWCWRPATSRPGSVSSRGANSAAPCQVRQTGIITLDGVRWAKARIGPAKVQDADLGVASPFAGRRDLCRPVVRQGRRTGRRPVSAAAIAGSFRRDGGDGSLDRPRARHGRRLLVRPEPVQSRHPGLSATGFVVQTVRVFCGARQRLYALDRRGRRADRDRSGAGRRRLASGKLCGGQISDR